MDQLAVGKGWNRCFKEKNGKEAITPDAPSLLFTVIACNTVRFWRIEGVGNFVARSKYLGDGKFIMSESSQLFSKLPILLINKVYRLLHIGSNVSLKNLSSGRLI